MEVGFIGTGLMGLPMAQRVIEAGFPLVAYNRTPAKLEPLQAIGATLASSPATLIHHATCIVLMLTNAQAIQEVLLSDDNRRELVGKTIIQMGTIAPSESRDLGDRIAEAGGEYLEAPVLGSIPEAQAGTLILMVGGTPDQFDQWQPVLQCFGPEPILIGPVGTAAAVKLALNQLIGSLTCAFATSLSFVQAQGADGDRFMQILRGSALYAPTFDKKLSRMLDHNYANPNFPTKHLLKDTLLFLREAESLGVNGEMPEAVQRLLDYTITMGLAEADYSALFQAVRGSR
jgi:3-hydroxyisobutyrate dehydrogenase-like beta-hydroxyacid dehydrogenase